MPDRNEQTRGRRAKFLSARKSGHVDFPSGHRHASSLFYVHFEFEL